MSEDVKNAINDFKGAFEEYKKVNDERLDEISKGNSGAELESKLEKIEADLQSIEDVNQNNSN